MGFFSAISRILKSMAVGALMLPRIDHSVMPDGFQQLDPGNLTCCLEEEVKTNYYNRLQQLSWVSITCEGFPFFKHPVKLVHKRLNNPYDLIFSLLEGHGVCSTYIFCS